MRAHNEDAFLARDYVGLWAVADGMGGYAHGEKAAARVIEGLAAIDPGGDFDEASRQPEAAILAANAAIFAESARLGPMGTTVASLLICGGRYAVHWAGDSRAWLWRDGRLAPLSRDHGQVQEMVAAGQLAPEAAFGHPLSNILVRAVGLDAELKVDVVTGEIRPDDLFLLSTDGLHAYVEDAEIIRCLGGSEPDGAADALIGAALARGGPDNVTVIVVNAAAA
ncbi:MAG: PP2C family protein-serine/threonine phosphatase [Sphingosinicella sp.]